MKSDDKVRHEFDFDGKSYRAVLENLEKLIWQRPAPHYANKDWKTVRVLDLKGETTDWYEWDGSPMVSGQRRFDLPKEGPEFEQAKGLYLDMAEEYVHRYEKDQSVVANEVAKRRSER